MRLLAEKRKVLSDLYEKLEILNTKLSETMTKKIELEKEVSLCQDKLIRAETLINGLGSEKNR